MAAAGLPAALYAGISLRRTAPCMCFCYKQICWQWFFLCAWVALAQQAQAQEDDDASALMLADQTPALVAKASKWRNFVEAAAGEATPRGSASQGVQRVSLDTRYDSSLGNGWRMMFSDRLDLNAPAQTPGDNGINTLKEAYLSLQTGESLTLDIGRINVRNGLAQGYNPTDYFKAGATRSLVSVDPQSLKENRQGSFMLRGQQLWSGGSLTAIYVPKLADQVDNDAYSIDFGDTNSINRSLLIYSPRWSETISPQLLLFQQDPAATQVGINLAALLNDSTVLNLEWSGVQSTSQLSQALAQQHLAHANDSAFYSRWAASLNYTTVNKMSLTVEVEFNGLGLSQSGWNQLRSGAPSVYGVYANWVQYRQELPTQQSIFLYFNWQDAFMSRLDISAMQRYDLADDSNMTWLEARYHMLERTEFALQWQSNQGGNLSDFGVMPVRQNLLLVLRRYF